jgi:hypothetical protein
MFVLLVGGGGCPLHVCLGDLFDFNLDFTLDDGRIASEAFDFRRSHFIANVNELVASTAADQHAAEHACKSN